MKLFLFFVIFIVLNSCFVSKNKLDTITVKGKIDIHKPLCGGMKPNEEMSNGFFEPYSNATFYVKTKMNNDKNLETILTFNTDESGFYEFNIKQGVYVVIHEDKTLSLEKYIEKYSQTTTPFLEYIGDDLAKEAYEKHDFSLTVTERKEFNHTYKSQCFVGLNPLLKYNGPYPK
jgi:hypothetical protein